MAAMLFVSFDFFLFVHLSNFFPSVLDLVFFECAGAFSLIADLRLSVSSSFFFLFAAFYFVKFMKKIMEKDNYVGYKLTAHRCEKVLE